MKYYNITVSNACIVPPADGADGWGDVILGQSWGKDEQDAIHNWIDAYDGIPYRQMNKKAIESCGWTITDLSAQQIEPGKRKEPLSPSTVVCSECGGTNITWRTWSDCNNDSYSGSAFIDESDLFCDDCQEHTNQVTYLEYCQYKNENIVKVVIGRITHVEPHHYIIHSISQVQSVSVNTDIEKAVSEMVEDIKKDGDNVDVLVLNNFNITVEMDIPENEKKILVIPNLGLAEYSTVGDYIHRNLTSDDELLLHTNAINSIINLSVNHTVPLSLCTIMLDTLTDEEKNNGCVLTK